MSGAIRANLALAHQQTYVARANARVRAAGAVLGVAELLVIGSQLELHDLCFSKAVVGREKDREFCRALLRRGVIMADVLDSRLDTVPLLDPRVRSTTRTLATRTRRSPCWPK